MAVPLTTSSSSLVVNGTMSKIPLKRVNFESFLQLGQVCSHSRPRTRQQQKRHQDLSHLLPHLLTAGSSITVCASPSSRRAATGLRASRTSTATVLSSTQLLA